MGDDIQRILHDWPGKSGIDGQAPHPAVWHMLDVAAVAELLIAPCGFPRPVRDALVLLTALHDLGKIGAKFRAMILTGAHQAQGRHWELTEVWLHHHDTLLTPVLGLDKYMRLDLYAATAGHHGRPPCRQGHDLDRVREAAGSEASADAATVIAALAPLWPEASLAGLTRAEVRALSWWLPGLVAAADWVGSNATWFPAQRPDQGQGDPARYLEPARQRAAAAVAAAGLAVPTVAPGPLFPGFALRPMQLAAADIPLPDGPTLAVIEDETGAGKTEAALILAQRMLAAGKGRGLFVALPTTATADAMFRRAGGIVGRMFAARPSLALAHGRAALSEDFRALVGNMAAAAEVEEDTPFCSDWLADDRRRALLATVGVGTIDQALLSVLPTRFSTLRHYALSAKILIVDEVHELGEPYLATELAALLRAHRMAGGSAILLTATLPLAQRAALIRAFGAEPADDPAYPALTIAGGAARRDLPQATGPRGPVAVARLASPEAAVALLAEAAGQGAACVWVRNAVDDAIAAAEALRAQGIPTELLHARFAMTDRLRHEAAALARFGKDGEGRAGRVLVATQVVESSLDLDFDVMVSDLAPMAALIQRAGRLWRHMDRRPAATRPVRGPVLHVLSPDPAVVADAQWLHRVLDRGAWVYPLDLQWRTAAVLFAAGAITAPSGLRGLIEAVHGAPAMPLPEPLLAAELLREGQGYAAQNLALQNLVDLASGFRNGARAAKAVDYPTRLGREQRTLVLARREGGRLRPWAAAQGGTAAGAAVDPAAAMTRAWALSEVQVAVARLTGIDLPDQTAPEIVGATAGWPGWRRESVKLCPVADDGTITTGLRYDPDRGILFDTSG